MEYNISYMPRALSGVFSGRFDTSGSMIPLSVPEIEGGSPDYHGEGEGAEGLVLEYSSSWMVNRLIYALTKYRRLADTTMSSASGFTQMIISLPEKWVFVKD